MRLEIVALLAMAAGAAPAAGESSSSIVAGLSSNKDRGVVSVMAEPTLADGRLVLKVAAFNSAHEPARLAAQDVKIFTAAGKPVALLTLAQLIDETTAGAGGRSSDRAAADAHQPANYSGPGIARNAGGEPDVSTYSGASNPTAGVVPRHVHPDAPRPAEADKQRQDQIASLKAGVLQDVLIAPASAAGGQVVSEKLKFSRKEERTLRLVVDFNGELHEFNFAPPPTR